MVRADADFRRYWISRVVSQAGDWVTYVVLPVLVYRLTGSTFLTAVTSGLAAAAYLVFGLVAGALGDRLDRRALMVTCDVVSAIVVGSVPVAALFGRLWVAHLLVVAFAVQVFYTFFDGANFGALPVLVGQDRVAMANAGVWTATSVLDILVPPLTGAALAVVAPTHLLALDALSFAASALLVSRIRRPMHDLERSPAGAGRGQLRREIAEGVSYLSRHAGLRTVTVVGVLQSAAAGGMIALLVPWCDQVLRIGTKGWQFSAIYTAWGLGGLVASALMPFLLRRLTSLRLTLLATPASAATGVVVAATTTWWAAVAGVLAWSVAGTAVSVGLVSYRQEVTPERLLSRVNTAGRMLSWGIGGTGGALAVGALASVAGVRSTIVAVACFGLVGATVAWTSPLRRAEAPGEVAPG